MILKSIRIIYENKYIVLYIHAFQIVWREGLVNSNTRGLKMGKKLFDYCTITSKAKIKAAFLYFSSLRKHLQLQGLHMFKEKFRINLILTFEVDL